MKKFLIGIIVILLSQMSLHAQNKSFGVGENLYYVIKYSSRATGDIIGGYAKVSIIKKTKYRGVDVYMVRSSVRTSKTLDNFFKIRDTLTTYWDYKNQRPMSSEKIQHEGNYYNYLYTSYYHSKKNSSAKYYRKWCKCDKAGKKWKEKSGGQSGLPSNIHDIMSALYSMRMDSRQGKPGHRFYIDMYDDAKLQKFQMNIIKYDNITIKNYTVTDSNNKRTRYPSYSFKALKVMPKMKTSGFFKAKGNVYVWVSNDINRYILKVQGQIPELPGSFIIQLVSVKKGK